MASASSRQQVVERHEQVRDPVVDRPETGGHEVGRGGRGDEKRHEHRESAPERRRQQAAARAHAIALAVKYTPARATPRSGHAERDPPPGPAVEEPDRDAHGVEQARGHDEADASTRARSGPRAARCRGRGRGRSRRRPRARPPPRAAASPRASPSPRAAARRGAMPDLHAGQRACPRARGSPRRPSPSGRSRAAATARAARAARPRGPTAIIASTWSRPETGWRRPVRKPAAAPVCSWASAARATRRKAATRSGGPHRGVAPRDPLIAAPRKSIAVRWIVQKAPSTPTA